MKPFYILITAVGVLTSSMFFSSNLTGQEAEGETEIAKKKLVILTGDDFNHRCGEHEFGAGGKLLKSSVENSVLANHVEVIHVHNWPKDASVFNDADMVLHYYAGNKGHKLNNNTALIDKLVEKGVGQMFVHYACDPDTSINDHIKKWTGGVYKDKFSGNPHWLLKSQLEKHPINKGVDDYTMHDEWYLRIDFESLPLEGYKEVKVGQVHSVMSGENKDEEPHKKFKNAMKYDDGSTNVVFWAKESENGSRGIAVTGAHNHNGWTNNEFRKQVLNSISWGLKIPVPEDGVSSPEITEEQLNENLEKRKPEQKRLKLFSQN